MRMMAVLVPSLTVRYHRAKKLQKRFIPCGINSAKYAFAKLTSFSRASRGHAFSDNWKGTQRANALFWQLAHASAQKPHQLSSMLNGSSARTTTKLRSAKLNLSRARGAPSSRVEQKTVGTRNPGTIRSPLS